MLEHPSYDLLDWFSQVLRRPLIHGQEPQALDSTVKRYISPGPKLTASQRIGIYNQQYWWRLLKVMQESFPLIARLFGTLPFRTEIATPFLCACAPDNWNLDYLGARLPQWLDDHYKGSDKAFVVSAAQIDWAFTRQFTAGQRPLGDLSRAGEDKIYLQPTASLWTLDYDLFPFRETLLQFPVEHWLENPFPALGKEGPYVYCLYRTSLGHLLWQPLSAAQYQLLCAFTQGMALTEAFAGIEAGEEVAIWFQEWTAWNWITLTPP